MKNLGNEKNGHFTAWQCQIKIELSSNINEMFPEFAELWPPCLFFPMKVSFLSKYDKFAQFGINRTALRLV